MNLPVWLTANLERVPALGGAWELQTKTRGSFWRPRELQIKTCANFPQSYLCPSTSTRGHCTTLLVPLPPPTWLCDAKPDSVLQGIQPLKTQGRDRRHGLSRSIYIYIYIYIQMRLGRSRSSVRVQACWSPDGAVHLVLFHDRFVL